MKEIWVNGGELIPAYFSGRANYVSIQATAYYWCGLFHREDGPAVIFGDGEVEYWIQGQKLSPGEFFERTTSECQEEMIWNMDRW